MTYVHERLQDEAPPWPLFLLRCLWNKVPSQRRPTAPVRPSPQGSQSWKCIYASVKPSEIKYHPCAKRFVIFPLQLWLTGGGGGQVLLGFREMVLYFTNTGPSHMSNPRKKNKMRPAKDHFGHCFFFSRGMCEAIPGSPPTSQNTKTTKPRSIQSSEQKGRRKKRKPMIILFVLAQTTPWCNRFSSDVVSAWKILKATHYYYSHARPYQLK